MRWLNDDEGGVAIIVAISMVVLFGLGALVLDVGNLFWERRQLQNGADAGAIAAAQDLASGEGAVAAEAQARTYTSENNTRDAYMERMTQPTANSVRVETITGSVGSIGVLESLLAGVIGTNDYFARAEATATWGGIGNASTIPLTFSECEWDLLTDGLGVDGIPTDEKTVYHHTDPQNGDSCGEKDPPGGFGWLDEDGTGSCSAQVVMGEVGGDTGSGSPTPSASTGCTESFFQELLGETVLMPIFTTVTGTGSGATYQIIGFAAVEITGYRVRGGPQWTSDPAPCSGNDRCIRGKFVAYYDLGEQPDPTAPDYGAYTIGLTG